MKPLLALCLGLAGSATLPAALITFGSNGAAVDPNETNSTASPTIAIAKHPAWVDPLLGTSWVSFGITGNPSAPGYFVVGNGTVVSFFDRLVLPRLPQVASITVRADDSTGLRINGVQVFAEASQVGNTYWRCSDLPVGCLASTEATVDITSYLVQGVNTLQFDVGQRNAVSFGVNYGGTVRLPEGNDEVPEPATFVLIGAGLVSLYGLRRRG